MIRKGIKILFTILVVTLIAAAFAVSGILFGVNVTTGGQEAVIYIPQGATYSQAMDSIQSNLRIKNERVFEWIARKKSYPGLVKPGRYVIDQDLSYAELINIFRSGRQTPLMLTFNNVRTLEELAGKVGGRIEADSLQLITFLSDPENYRKDGFAREDVISVFLPDTYEFFWNTGAAGFYERMLREYRRFWTGDRIAKAELKGLTLTEVSVLASIVEEEVARADEGPKVAGVYLNRLRRGIPLQADPTIKFALSDFTITRVLRKHLQVDSPYNTYRNRGLPPGPIRCPSVESINAVLDAEEHDYIYFVAKADFSGYHNFSRTLAEHNRYAAIYQKELNKRKIFR